MNKFLLFCVCLFSSSAHAWNCKYEKDIDLQLDLEGTRTLEILAAAGDLEVRGHGDRSDARVRGRVCVSEEEWLDRSTVEITAGETAEIYVEIPAIDSSWTLMNPSYAYIDLRIDVPDSIPLDIKDSSGDVDIDGSGKLSLRDSSGDVRIEDVQGAVTVFDSSGDLDFEDINGDVTIGADSSGDVYGRDVEGSVRVVRDSSGDIRFIDVGGDFTVERDSSGDITARGVGGDLEVIADGSGEINYSEVRGDVLTPRG